MELGETERIWMIGRKAFNTAFQIGYAKAYLHCDDRVLLVSPFTAVWHPGEPGLALCRGPWRLPFNLPANEVVLTEGKVEPWMFLSQKDLNEVETYLLTLDISISRNGKKRGFGR